MKKLITNLTLISLVMGSVSGTPSYAEDRKSVNAADVVILVDFSGSITEDPRYPLAEKKALENLVNVSWPLGSKVAIIAFGASDSRNGGKPSTFPMCQNSTEILRNTSDIDLWIDDCVQTIGTSPVGPMTDHNKALKRAVEILSGPDSLNPSKFVLLMTDGKLDVDNINPVNPDYVGSSEDRDKQAIEELFAEVLPDARAKGIQIWPVGFGDVNRIELNGYAPEGGQPGPESCQREIPKAVIAEPEDLPFEINKIIRQVTCQGEYIKGDNVEVMLPDFADKATVNVQHGPGETFNILGPDGESINGGGEGTETTITIPNPTGGIWQVVGNSDITVGYWWESTFEPVITCPDESNIVSISITPSYNTTNSYVNSPIFEVEVIAEGEKTLYLLELGEEETFTFTNQNINVIADASVSTLDQPGIVTFKRTEENCSNNLITSVNPNIEEPPVIEDADVVDFEEEGFAIPWWLFALFGLTLLYIIWYLLNKRYLKEGTFIISDNTGQLGRIRVLKRTKNLTFSINKDEQYGSQVSKSKPGTYGAYEVSKGKRGPDFIIFGPTGTGKETEYPFTIGDKLSLEDGYEVEFEDGYSRKSLIENDNPFEDNTSEGFIIDDELDSEDENNPEESPFG